MHKKTHAFTLIELMVTLAVIAIVAALVGPNLRQFTSNNRLVAGNNQLIGDLTLARSEAIRRNITVTICASTTGTTCSLAANWAVGWIVFSDQNQNNIPDLTDTLLKVTPGLQTGITLTSTLFESTALNQYLGNGTLRDNPALPAVNTGGTFKICDSTANAAIARAVNINIMGRPSVAVDNDNNNIVEDLAGADITCP